MFLTKRSTLQLQILPQNNSFNNRSKNNPVIKTLPMLMFAIATSLSILPQIIIDSEMEENHPWLIFIKGLPIDILWGIIAPGMLYILNKEAKSYVLEMYKESFRI